MNTFCNLLNRSLLLMFFRICSYNFVFNSVSNSIRLLGLPDEVLELIKEGLVSVGHAKVLLSVEDENLVINLASRVAEGTLTVRALESIAASL